MDTGTIEFELDVMPGERLSRVSFLVKQLRAAELRVRDAEEQLAREKAALDAIQCQALPEAMQELGLRELKTNDGAKVAIKDEVFPASLSKLPADKRDAVFAWMRGHGADALIKRTLTLGFGRGEDAIAEKVVEMLHKLLPHDIGFSDKQDVNANTLKAFCKEHLASFLGRGQEDGIDRERAEFMETFGIYQFSKAIVKEERS